MKRLVKIIAPMVFCVGGTANAAPIDLFSDWSTSPTGTGLYSYDANPSTGGVQLTVDGSTHTSSALETGLGLSVTGGARSLWLTSADSANGLGKQAGFGVGYDTTFSTYALAWSNGPGVHSTASVTWDGANAGTAGTLCNTSASCSTLGTFGAFATSQDLKAGGKNGFELKSLISDQGFKFQIVAWTDATHWSMVTADADNIAGVKDYLFANMTGGACGAFGPIGPGGLQTAIQCGTGGGADFSNIWALQANFTYLSGTSAVDLEIADVHTVPEPTSLALMGIGMLAAGGVARRRLIKG